MTAEGYEQTKLFADYAATEGIIGGHPRGNISSYCDFCIQLGNQYMRQYVLKKRGFK